MRTRASHGTSEEEWCTRRFPLSEELIRRYGELEFAAKLWAVLTHSRINTVAHCRPLEALYVSQGIFFPFY